MKILIVEDDVNSRVFLERALLSQGYIVESAANGVQALEKAVLSPPDLIISDIMMPEMDGFELCRSVRTDERLKTIPFVFYTATYIEQKDEKLAMALGASRFLIKPMEPEEFFNTISKVIEEHRSGHFPVPDQLPADMTELDRLQVEAYARKLDKKVREIEREREGLRRAKEELKFRNVILSTQQEASIDGILVVDESGRILSFNRRFCELWNIPSEVLETKSDECILQSMLDNIVDPGSFLHKVRYLYEHRQEINRDEISLHDGRTFDRYSAPMLGIDGKYYGRVWYFRDITERIKMEEKLNEEKAFTENALNMLRDVFFVFDLQGKFLRWNKAVNDVTGYSDGEIALMKPAEFFPNADTERISKAIQSVAEEGSVELELSVVAKDGRQIPYEIRASLLRDSKGNSIGISGVGRDVTDRNKLENQLRHSQKMEAVGTMAGGIAHDFNNILNAISGFGTLVMDRIGDDPLSKEHMHEVLSAAERAANLTKRLLVFSRKQAVEVKPVNINELILGLQKMLCRTIRENIELSLDLADRQLKVMADFGQIEQVLMNLATNARDAMPEGGRLIIGTGLQELDDEYVAAYGYGKPGIYALITVADTGQGMDEETRKKIFEPFFTTKGIGEGTGLGLAISYGIIKQHNGYIKVYSEIGKGTEFKIYLPLIEDPAALEKTTEVPVSVKGGNETILVAEDDAALRKLSRIVLESSGYTVITAEDGEDAIAKFMENRERISLVLLDMIMPKKNGKEVGEAIRKVSPGTKILFASGYTMDIIMTKELTESGFDFILKPVSPRDLLKKVREVLDR